jgi:hypothetical protein
MSYSPETRFSQSFTTTNNTPTVAFSVPIPAASAAFVQVDFVATNSTFSSAAGGDAEAIFTRTAAGNVVRATGNGGLLDAAITLMGNFTLMPKAEIVANTTTQAADIRLTGIAATTITWTFTINARRVSL